MNTTIEESVCQLNCNVVATLYLSCFTTIKTMITTIEGSRLTTQLQPHGYVEFKLLNNCQESCMKTQIQRCN